MGHQRRAAFRLFCILFLFSACGDNHTLIKGMSGNEPRIRILPLGDFPMAKARAITADVQKIVGNVTLLSPLPLPHKAYYRPRDRYRADSLIRWMRGKASAGEVYVGLTLEDISTTKNEHADFGVMGLAYTPGNACVASNKRLRNKNNFFKVVIHEMGHTTGLPHCPQKNCYMRDAKGGDHTAEEKGFCQRCSRHLQLKGWKLS